MENFYENTIGRLLHGGGGKADESQTFNIITKIIGIVAILIVGWVFGMIPHFW